MPAGPLTRVGVAAAVVLLQVGAGDAALAGDPPAVQAGLLAVDRYDGPERGQDYGEDVAVDPTTGNAYVTGGSENPDWSHADIVTFGYDRTGSRIWTQRYDGERGSRDYAYAIGVDSVHGVVYVAGVANDSTVEGPDIVTLAYSLDGARLWTRVYDGGPSDAAFDLAVDPVRGRVYVTGESDTAPGVRAYATVAYDSAGNQVWVNRDTGGNAFSSALAVAVTQDTGVVSVTGLTGDSQLGVRTVSYTPDGRQAWTDTYRGNGWPNTSARDIAVDQSTGSVYVTGAVGTGGGTNLVTLAYSRSGKRLWVDRYGGTYGFEEGAALAVDPTSGSVYVAGSTYEDGDHLVTIALDRSGDRRWIDVAGRPWYRGRALTIALDPERGTVYVGGQQDLEFGDTDYVIKAYRDDGAPGAVLSYDGPAGEDDAVRALAVDPARGTVWATGSSQNRNLRYDIVTIAARPTGAQDTRSAG